MIVWAPAGKFYYYYSFFLTNIFVFWYPTCDNDNKQETEQQTTGEQAQG